MQENKFENQVQHKLDDLKLHPSDSVWQNVYARIKKEKRRRRGLMILPILFIVFLCGGIWFWFSDTHSTKELQQLSKRDIATENSTETSQVDSDSIKNNIVIQENKSTKSGTANSDSDIKNPTHLPAQTKNSKIIPGNSSDHIPMDLANKSSDVNRLEEKELFTDSKKQNLKDDNTILTQDKDKSVHVAKGRDSSMVGKADSMHIDKEFKNAITAGNKAINKNGKDKLKWNYGFSFSAGVSDISHSFLGSDFLGYGSEEKSLFADATNYSSSPQPGTDTLSNSSKKPYLIKPSLAFNIGFFASKKISKKSSVTLGINYKSFSTTNKVGQKTDSGRYYRIQNPVDRYKNHYHFVEFPVSFSLQLAKPKNIPLLLNAGISISQLIASNALQFNKTTGIYYYDNSLFNKTQFGFSTGLYVSNKRNSILIGPHIYYGTTKIANEGLYKNAHFTYLGLHSNFLFRKK